MSLITRPQPASFEESINLCVEKAKTDGDDFRVKVFRRQTLAAPLESVANLSGARVEHLNNAESWLVPLCGGGPLFALAVFHEKDPNVLLATLVPPTVPTSGPNGAPAKAADPRIVATPGWNGPMSITYPLLPAAPPANGTNSNAGYRAFTDLTPGGAGEGASARGSFPTAAAGGGTFDFVGARLELVAAQHRIEMDALTKAMDASAKATERQIGALVESIKALASAPRAVEKPMMEQLVPLITAMSAIAVPIFQARAVSEAEARKLAAEAEARREERESKRREEEMKLQSALMERNASAASDATKMIAPVIDAISNIGKSQLQMIATMRELNAGEAPAEPGLIDFVKALAPAAAEFLAMRANPGAAVPPPRPSPQLAAPPAPAPAPAAAPQSAVEEEEEDITKVDPEVLIGELVDALKAHHNAEEVANGYLDALGNAGVVAAVNATGSTLNFFQAKLGTPWLTDGALGPDGKTNGDYIRSVVTALTAAATARGIKV